MKIKIGDHLEVETITFDVDGWPAIRLWRVDENIEPQAFHVRLNEVPALVAALTQAAVTLASDRALTVKQ